MCPVFAGRHSLSGRLLDAGGVRQFSGCRLSVPSTFCSSLSGTECLYSRPRHGMQTKENEPKKPVKYTIPKAAGVWGNSSNLSFYVIERDEGISFSAVTCPCRENSVLFLRQRRRRDVLLLCLFLSSSLCSTVLSPCPFSCLAVCSPLFPSLQQPNFLRICSHQD